jgi:DNA-binding protein HU-beta
MTKSELVKAVIENNTITKVQAEQIVQAVMDSVTHSLKKGENVRLVGFGTFSVSTRVARVGRNPSTGAEIKILANNTVKFKADSVLLNNIQ